MEYSTGFDVKNEKVYLKKGKDLQDNSSSVL
jgi:hypothetical protein